MAATQKCNIKRDHRLRRTRHLGQSQGQEAHQRKKQRDEPGVTARPRRPRTDSVVGADKVVAGVHSIISVCLATNELSVYFGSTVPTLVKGAQGLGEGG